ncbi:MAG TPA: aminoglycoside phosphotransferase family protein [Spirochaetia bacterium]|nr:aminoglycoside phosphotransferase family protein [Spirochaetia bacterium]
MIVRERLPLPDEAIAACLLREYGVSSEGIDFLPVGYDSAAAVYRVRRESGAPLFLKITRAEVLPEILRIPQLLADRGIPNAVAPIETAFGEPCCAVDGYTLILYPFIEGRSAASTGMTARQWQSFGRVLSAIHGSGAERAVADVVPHEQFAIPMIDAVRSMVDSIRSGTHNDDLRREFAQFWRRNTELILFCAERAEHYGHALQTIPFPMVLCHGDIHAGNILVDLHGELRIVDWDTPRIAPRERDLLFVIGSKIAGGVTAQEEREFFEGYGAVPVNRQALAYYRFERALEELYEGGRSVFLNTDSGPAVREADARFMMGLFEPGSLVESALDADRRLET